MRPILRWHGGKWMLAPWIISYFPPHRIYTECFGGAGSVLVRKERSYAEVYNDLDRNVVNLFRVLRDPVSAERLRQVLTATPFSRDEFEMAYEKADEPIEDARRLVIRSFMGFGSNAHNPEISTGFRSNSNRSGTTPALDWMNYPENVTAFVERLRGVVIENRSALDVFGPHDSPHTLHYVDPPYPHSTRSDSRGDYSFEMSDDNHRELAAVLRSLKGMVILSGYRCDLYDGELYAEWKSVERASLADGARERTEVLWMNNAAWSAQESLFSAVAS